MSKQLPDNEALHCKLENEINIVSSVLKISKVTHSFLLPNPVEVMRLPG